VYRLAGEQFFQPGGMFRGMPARHPPEERQAVAPGVSFRACAVHAVVLILLLLQRLASLRRVCICHQCCKHASSPQSHVQPFVEAGAHDSGFRLKISGWKLIDALEAASVKVNSWRTYVKRLLWGPGTSHMHCSDTHILLHSIATKLHVCINVHVEHGTYSREHILKSSTALRCSQVCSLACAAALSTLPCCQVHALLSSACVQRRWWRCSKHYELARDHSEPPFKTCTRNCYTFASTTNKLLHALKSMCCQDCCAPC
jgi:hypothetical protein